MGINEECLEFINDIMENLLELISMNDFKSLSKLINAIKDNVKCRDYLKDYEEFINACANKNLELINRFTKPNIKSSIHHYAIYVKLLLEKYKLSEEVCKELHANLANAIYGKELSADLLVRILSEEFNDHVKAVVIDIHSRLVILRKLSITKNYEYDSLLKSLKSRLRIVCSNS